MREIPRWAAEEIGKAVTEEVAYRWVGVNEVSLEVEHRYRGGSLV